MATAVNDPPMEAVNMIRSWLETLPVPVAKILRADGTFALFVASSPGEAHEALNAKEKKATVFHATGAPKGKGGPAIGTTGSNEHLVNRSLKSTALRGAVDPTPDFPLYGGTWHPQSAQNECIGETLTPKYQTAGPRVPSTTGEASTDPRIRQRTWEDVIGDDGRHGKRARLEHRTIRGLAELSASNSAYGGGEEGDISSTRESMEVAEDCTVGSDASYVPASTSDDTMSVETTPDETAPNEIIEIPSSSSDSDQLSEVSSWSQRIERIPRERTILQQAEQEGEHSSSSALRQDQVVSRTKARCDMNRQPKMAGKAPPRAAVKASTQMERAKSVQEIETEEATSGDTDEGHRSRSNKGGKGRKENRNKVDNSKRQAKPPTHLGAPSNAEINNVVAFDRVKARHPEEKPIFHAQTGTASITNKECEEWLRKQAARMSPKVREQAPKMAKYAIMLGGNEVLQSWTKILSQWRKQRGPLNADGIIVWDPLAYLRERATGALQGQTWTFEDAGKRISHAWTNMDKAAGEKHLTEMTQRWRKVDLHKAEEREKREMIIVHQGKSAQDAKKEKVERLMNSVVQARLFDIGRSMTEVEIRNKWKKDIAAAKRWNQVIERLGNDVLAIMPTESYLPSKWIERKDNSATLEIWFDLILHIRPNLAEWSRNLMMRIQEITSILKQGGNAPLLRFEVMDLESREKEQDRNRLLDFVEVGERANG